MRPMLTDTHPEAEAVQIELLRKAGVDRRLRLCCSLTRAALHQSRRAIARANPNLEPRELDLLFVRLQYGAELAQQVRQYLEQQAP